PGPRALRQGRVRAERVPVLLARLRDEGRVFRLLPQLPRIREALRAGPARRGPEKALLPERGEAGAGASEDSDRIKLEVRTSSSCLLVRVRCRRRRADLRDLLVLL